MRPVKQDVQITSILPFNMVEIVTVETHMAGTVNDRLECAAKNVALETVPHDVVEGGQTWFSRLTLKRCMNLPQ